MVLPRLHMPGGVPQQERADVPEQRHRVPTGPSSRPAQVAQPRSLLRFAHAALWYLETGPGNACYNRRHGRASSTSCHASRFWGNSAADVWCASRKAGPHSAAWAGLLHKLQCLKVLGPLLRRLCLAPCPPAVLLVRLLLGLPSRWNGSFFLFGAQFDGLNRVLLASCAGANSAAMPVSRAPTAGIAPQRGTRPRHAAQRTNAPRARAKGSRALGRMATLDDGVG
jgi:hypothetical protein